MKSWMMSLWLKNHEKSKWPDLSISQPEDACHVSMRDENHFEKAIEEMCSEGFFTAHGYRYVQWDDATAERAQEELYDDIDWKDRTQSSSDLQVEELYEDVPFAYQLRGGCNLRSPLELPDSNAFSIDPRYKNVQVDVTETDLQEEEVYEEIGCRLNDCLHVAKKVVDLKDVSTDPRYEDVRVDVTEIDLEEEAYDDVRSTKGVVDSKNVSTKFRDQNVPIRVTERAVDMVTEVPRDDDTYDDISGEEQIEEDESKIYEEIGNQSQALCHSVGTDEHWKNFGSESKYSYTAEDTQRETSDSEDDDLYEEMPSAVISNSFEACGSKSPESSDFNQSSEAVDCVEFTSNHENGSVATKGKDQTHDDPVYDEIGSLQLAEMRFNQNTTGNPGYRERLPREYMSLQREQASTLNPKDTSHAKKDVAKLNSRRRHCYYSEDTTENQFDVKEP